MSGRTHLLPLSNTPLRFTYQLPLMPSIQPRQPRLSGVEGGLLAAQRRAANNPSSLRSDTAHTSTSSARPGSSRNPVSYDDEDDPTLAYTMDDEVDDFVKKEPLVAHPAVIKGRFDSQEGRMASEVSTVPETILPSMTLLSDCWVWATSRAACRAVSPFSRAED